MKLIKIFDVFLIFCCLVQSDILTAAVRLGVSGNWEKNYLGLQVHTTQSYKGSISLDLGSNFRIGYSFGQATKVQQGYIDNDPDENVTNYVTFKEIIKQDAHGLNLFVILYAGRVFTPYMFVGGAIKYFKITGEEDGVKKEDISVGPIPVPSYGAGLSIAVNNDFAIRVSNTWSVGLSEDLEGNTRKERDSSLEVGVTYKIE